MYCKIYFKIKKLTKFLKTKILENVHLNFPKKRKYLEHVLSNVPKKYFFFKWSDNLIKNQKMSQNAPSNNLKI